MPNIDQTYIKARVGEDELTRLTDKSGGAINTTIVDAAIVDAKAIVDTVLFEKYGEPLVFASGDKGDRAKEFIRRIKYDIALYYLYNKKHDDEEMKDVYVRYNKAFKTLEQIKKGEFDIVGLMTANTSSYLMMTNMTEEHRIFTRDLLGWPGDE
jgi:phage gp36-like protein